MKKFLLILSAISLAAALTVSSSAALLGDVNTDGQINSADALGVLQYSVGISVKKFNKANADVNKDGRINSSDALKILRISVGLESADDTSTVKSEIVKTYNASLAKTYQQVKTATVTGFCAHAALATRHNNKDIQIVCIGYHPNALSNFSCSSSPRFSSSPRTACLAACLAISAL